MNAMPETEAADKADEAEEEAEESPVYDDEEYLREQYHDENKTQAQIAEKHDITASTVSHYMNKYGIETKGHQVKDERLDDAEWLADQYLEEGEDRTMQDIADEVGCSDGTVMRRLREHGIIEAPEDEEEEAEGDDEEDEEAAEDEAEEADGDEDEE
jgi:transposase-like protein